MSDPHDLKFRSSMTLFYSVFGDISVFREALVRFYSGEPDRVTLGILRAWQGSD
ncbi:MAG: DUF1810 family protein [Spirochaetales bacterium]|nr:MAG: DUF1810 family protein [Spirochaetales bacterium]